MKTFFAILWLKLSGQWFKPYYWPASKCYQPMNRRGDKVTEISVDKKQIEIICGQLNQNKLNGFK